MVHRLLTALVVLVVFAACRERGAVPSSESRATARPNFLVLLTDDQRWDAVGYENPLLVTPHLDALAERAMRFDNAFVTSSICPASRASILTGAVERVHRLTFGTPPLADPLTSGSYPALLRASGYHVGLVGKIGVDLIGGGPAHFDRFVPIRRDPYLREAADGSTVHVTELVTSAALDFLEEASRLDRPFALSVGFHAPHASDREAEQYFWPAFVDELYRDVEFPKPKLGDPAIFEALPGFLRTSKNRERWAWRFDTPEKYQRMVAGYYRMVSGVDRAVGAVLADLERLGLAESTVVVFTSDNGYFLGERGLAGKWLGYDEALRVPLLVFDPRREKPERGGRGRRSDALVLNTDIAPTLLDLAGVSSPPWASGRSLAPLLAGSGAGSGAGLEWRDDFFFEHLFDEPDIPKHEGVRTARYKYIRYFEQEPPYEELFDLASDPAEQFNVASASEHAAALERLRRRADELASDYAERHRAALDSGSGGAQGGR